MYRIMIVDDEVNVLKTIARRLSLNKEWEVETYSDTDDALLRAQSATFDLFISDYRMPKMNGVEFLAAVRGYQPEATRMILSGHSDVQALTGAINEAQIFRYFHKPWDDDELEEAIHQALEHNRLVVENRRLADTVRQQQELNRNEAMLAQPEKASPGITQVDLLTDGSIYLDESET
jgi:two-component system, probable response regulator PhcQ